MSIFQGNRRDITIFDLLPSPGDYGKKLDGKWYCCAPIFTGDLFTSLIGNLSGHKVTEHHDGTITVSPSILLDNGQFKWHGYLEYGIWREC